MSSSAPLASFWKGEVSGGLFFISMPGLDKTVHISYFCVHLHNNIMTRWIPDKQQGNIHAYRQDQTHHYLLQVEVLLLWVRVVSLQPARGCPGLRLARVGILRHWLWLAVGGEGSVWNMELAELNFRVDITWKSLFPPFSLLHNFGLPRPSNISQCNVAYSIQFNNVV